MAPLNWPPYRRLFKIINRDLCESLSSGFRPIAVYWARTGSMRSAKSTSRRSPQAADAAPVLVPALGDRYLNDWLESFDGILFTGSPSNVEPHRYQGPACDPGTWHDPERDATTLPMIEARGLRGPAGASASAAASRR